MELLIRTRDKSADPLASKAGDVIVACPDGWPWTETERTHPDWVIVRVPLLPVERDALIAIPTAQGTMTAQRAQRLDVSKLATRRKGETVTAMTRAAVVAAVTSGAVVSAAPVAVVDADVTPIEGRG